MPLACRMHHAPFAILQLPIETETVNMAPSACRSISQATVDAKIDAKSMPDFDATVVVKAHRSQPAFWAVTYGTAKVPQGATLVDVRPCVARNPKLAWAYDPDLDSDLDCRCRLPTQQLQLKILADF